MSIINVNLFGNPTVLKDDELISFPFKKAEALFYYLLVYKQASRDTLVNILWGETEEKTAKKNLRQAMYKIRKAFDMDIVISPKKSTVILNPEIHIEVDLYDFLSNSEDCIDVYKGEFLEGFYVKEAEEFEGWMLQHREHMKDLYTQKLNEQIENALKKNDEQRVLNCAKKLIDLDDFDEHAYRVLMKVYLDKGVFHKVTDLYNKLCKILKEELGIEPNIETKKLFDESLLRRSVKEMKERQEDSLFYGRIDELKVLKKYYQLFDKNEETKSIVIMGEPGIGKSGLNECFLDSIKQQDMVVIKSNCYQAEQEYILKPWNDVFVTLLDIIKEEDIKIPSLWLSIISNVFPDFAKYNIDMNYNTSEKIDLLQRQVIEEAMISVLNQVSQKRKIVLSFEDIQWMDDASSSLIRNILLHQKNKNIFLMGTCRNGYTGKIEQIINSAVRYNKIEKICLNSFDQEEMKEFMHMALPENNLQDELYERIYEETGGNAFFITEVINTIKQNGDISQMTAKMQDILKNRFLEISKEGKKILNIASMFFDKISLDMIKDLSQHDVLELMDIVDEIQTKGILREVSDHDKIYFAFTHQKLREYIYTQQSNARRKILHNQIGFMLEKKLHHDKRDRLIYPKLIYHFENAGNHFFALKYRMKNLDVYLNFAHELFPVLKDGNIEDEYNRYLSQEEEVNFLEDIEKDLIESIKNDPISMEVKKLQVKFLHMRGRYLIREGEYERGIKDVQNMIKISMQIKDLDYAIKGYLQMIYYGIQIYNTTLMDENIEFALDLATACNYQKDVGILWRLKGIQKIMEGNYKDAEDLIIRSIKVFELENEFEDKYTLNRAAGYNYLGEIRRHKMSFMRSLNYYDRAVKICNEKNITHGVTIFYTNAGQAAFDMGDYDGAKVYFKKAFEVYDKLNILWGRSTGQGYMSLLYIMDGKYKKGLLYYLDAKECAEKLKSPYELGLLYRVKAEIKVRIEQNPKIKEVFGKYLPKEVGYYCEEGIKYLKQLNNPYEIQILKALDKNGEKL
ncbi:AAA family ATPase [Lutibacter sp. B2]|nr:AAA family ATPase [Lutibacter sp. B2]